MENGGGVLVVIIWGILANVVPVDDERSRVKVDNTEEDLGECRFAY